MTVLGYDPTANFYAQETVQFNSMSISSVHVAINGGLLLTAIDQPLWVKNATYEGWLTDPENLTTGDWILNVSSGNWVQVSSIGVTYSPLDVYDLHVDGLYDFIANGLLLSDKPARNPLIPQGPTYVDMTLAWQFAEVGVPLVFYSEFTGGTPNYTYSWSFGDGSPAVSLSNESNTTRVTYSYSNSGNFTVVLNATDSTGFTMSISLNVTVFPRLVASPSSATRSDVDSGQSTTLSIMVSGGDGSYAINWTGLPPECASVNSTILLCTPITSGTFSIYAVLYDTSGDYTWSGYFTLSVYSDPSITPIVATPGSGHVDRWQGTLLAVQASGGTGIYTYSWSGLPPGCTSSNMSSLSCTPSSAGSYSLQVTLTDSNHFAVSSTILTFVVDSDPVILSPTAIPSSVFQGSPTAFSSSASGGAGGNTYAWAGLPAGCASQDTLTLQCTPSSYGTFIVTVAVTDSNGYSVTSSVLIFTVYSTGSAYLQEATSITQMDNGLTDGFYAWYVSLNLTTSPYPTLYGFNGLTNTGDSYEIAVAYNWPDCNAGFEMYHTWGNATGSTVGTVCDPTTALTAGDNVGLDLSVSDSGSTSGDVCFDLYLPASALTPTSTYCVAQPDGGAQPANNWFVPTTTTLNRNGYFTGMETQTISNNVCPTFSSMPAMTYQWASGIQPTEYSMWAQEFQAGGSTCWSYASPVFDPTSNYYTTTYVQAASVGGSHWEGAQDISNINNDYWWQFTSDAAPTSAVSTSVTASQQAADVGQTVTYTPSVTGGTSPYSCYWYLDDVYQVEDCTGVTFTPSAAGTYTIEEYTQDASGNTYGPSNVVTTVVSSDPTVTKPTASPTSVDVGQSVTFTITTSGGSGGNTIAWIGPPTGCTSANALSLTCTPTGSGTFSVTVTVTDSNGFAVTSSARSFTVYGTLSVTYTAYEYYWDGYEWVYDFQASCGGTLYSYQNYGEMIEFVATTTGGAAISGYTWAAGSPAWYYQNSNWNYETSPVSGGSAAYFAYDSSYAGGTISPQVTVTDSNGASASHGCSFYVA